MRIGLIPETGAERVSLRRQTVPVPMMETFVGTMLARSIMAGVRLGVFAALTGGARRAGEIAAATSCSVAGVRALCDALVGCGYLARRGERYALAPAAKRWLLPGARQSVVDFIEFHYDQWLLWSSLEDIVRSGNTLDFHHQVEDTALWGRYMRGMRVLENLNAEALVKALPLAGATSLLDIGGGPGFHAVALCRRYPRLRATVLDLERAAAIGRELVREAGMDDRITYRVGDARSADLGSDHDVVLLFNVMHHLDRDDNRRLCERVHDALKPGGIFVIGEQFKIAAPSPKEQFELLIGLQFFLSSGADTCPLREVHGWLKANGFGALRTAPAAAGLTMLIGRKGDRKGARASAAARR